MFISQTKLNFYDASSNSENLKMEVKTTTKIYSFRLLRAIALRHHHYEIFFSETELTKLIFVKGESGNSPNKNCVRFLDASLLKMQQKWCFFMFKNTQKSRKKCSHLLKIYHSKFSLEGAFMF